MKHDEIKGFLEGVVGEERWYDTQLERREKIKEGIQERKEELQAVEDKIRKTDRQGMARQ